MKNFPKRTMWDKHMEALGLLVGSWEEVQLRKLEKQRKKDEEKEAIARPKRERDARLLSMRLDEELTLDQMAEREGVTGERIRQLLKNIERREGIKIARPSFASPPVNVHCHTCNTDLIKSASKAKEGRKFYCEVHKNGRKYDYPEGLTARQRDNFRQWSRYHTEPEFKERQLNAVKIWAKRMRKEKNPRYLLTLKRAVQRYMAKHMKDPEWRKAHNAKIAAKHKERMVTDPEYRARRDKYDKLRYAKLKAKRQLQ